MRIIAGKHRGLNLNTFEADNIRPTIDRVRENIFNKIQFEIANSCVLDLFGGTGAVSLEFISRGASEVITVDNNPNSIKLIKKNFDKAKEKLNLIEKDFKDALFLLKNKKFDYIFSDPPFAENYGEEALNLISNYDMLTENGLIIYEHINNKEFNIPKNMILVDNKKYGTVSVSFLRWAND
ncbi:MAG: 16S rRNA (guanine(966)-N(2))-methyltransferase RsmD [Christensenellales bacterium]